jgi:ATP-dependent Lon protease
MRDYRDAKAMAQSLRELLAVRSTSISHAASLELVAKIFGCNSWNVLSAAIQSAGTPSASRPRAAERKRRELPLIAMRDFVLFPGQVAPIFVGRVGTKQAVEAAEAADNRVLMVAQKRSGDDDPAPSDLHGVGVIADIMNITHLPADNTVRILVKGCDRAKLLGQGVAQFPTAKFALVEETRGNAQEALALKDAVLAKILGLIPIDEGKTLSLRERLSAIESPGQLADAVVPYLRLPLTEMQGLLEAADVVVRLEKILVM